MSSAAGDLSPLAQQVYAAFEGDGDTTIYSASIRRPVPDYVDGGRDELIKEWGLCVGLAYAVACSEERFGGLASARVLAQEIADEVWASLHPEDGKR